MNSNFLNLANALNKQGQESGGCFNGFSHPQVLTIPPLVHTTPSNRSNNVQQIFRDNFEQVKLFFFFFAYILRKLSLILC
jgi:hypothetical protein